MAVKSKKATGLAVKGQFTKAQVPELLEVVLAKINALKKNYGGNEPGLSNDNLPGFGKISDLSDVPTLVQAISSVRGREKGYVEAMEKDVDSELVLNVTLTKFPFKLSGSTAKVWVAQINRRIGEVTYKEELQKLEAAAELLNRHTTEEQKFSNDMAKFADVMGL